MSLGLQWHEDNIAFQEMYLVNFYNTGKKWARCSEK